MPGAVPGDVELRGAAVHTGRQRGGAAQPLWPLLPRPAGGLRVSLRATAGLCWGSSPPDHGWWQDPTLKGYDNPCWRFIQFRICKRAGWGSGDWGGGLGVGVVVARGEGETFWETLWETVLRRHVANPPRGPPDRSTTPPSPSPSTSSPSSSTPSSPPSRSLARGSMGAPLPP